MPYQNELALLLDEPMASFSVVRELTAEDVASLRRPQKGQGTGPTPLMQIRHTHHLLARLIADGTKLIDAARISGYSSGHISSLQRDPAFQELIAHYAEQKDVIYYDYHQGLAVLGTTAMQALQARLDEAPEKLSTGELRTIMESAYDRSVAPAKGGPKAIGNGAAGATGITVQVQFVESQRGALIDARATEIEEK